MDLQQQPHRRFNPLTGEWLLVSPHRTQRPWQGQIEKPAAQSLPSFDPQCYLCPGNERAGGQRNPAYKHTFVFENDFAALNANGQGTLNEAGLLQAEAESGGCRVVCFSPRHDLTLARMPVRAIRRMVDVWVEQHAELAARDDIGYVQVFENRGEMMGCSNPHPHGQIWATRSLPVEPGKEAARQGQHFNERGTALLADYLDLELARGERIVCVNEGFVALVPFWAVWPFETLVLPRQAVSRLEDLGDEDRNALASILKVLTACYDRLFDAPFPYSMGFHPAPADGAEHPEWVVHAHFYPPLLRSATIRKFMVGFEMLGMPQRDLTAEEAAKRLRSLLQTDPR